MTSKYEQKSNFISISMILVLHFANMNYFIIYLYVLCLLKIKVFGIPIKVLFPNEETDEDFIYGKSPTTSKYDKESQHNKPHHKFPIDDTSCLTIGTMEFCEDDENQEYPSNEYIESLLKKSNGTYDKYFDGVMNRDNFPAESEPTHLCETYRRKFYPKIVKNEDHDWRVIINLKKYHQSIPVELCQEASSPCLFSEYYPHGYSSSCTQKYGKIPLISLDDHDEIVISEYEYPSHCNCDIHYTWRK